MLEPKDLKRKLARIGDEELRGLILTLTVASGMDGAKAEALCADIPGLRKMLNGLDEGNIIQLLGSLGDGKAADILKKIGSK